MMLSAPLALALVPEGEWGVLALLILAAFAAGWVDAVVGGGGLLQLPALLLMPGITPVQALATNKLASVFGTASSSITYYRKLRPDLRSVGPMAAIALFGSFGGATVASLVPASAFRPVIVAALIVVAVVTVLQPGLGSVTRLKYRGRRQMVTAAIAGGLIGFYDGVLGPGTGTFLVVALVALLGYNFLAASARAKIVNFATNLGALLFFIPLGAVLWPLALVMAVANIAGSMLGARMAIAKGAMFVRVIFLIVVTALVAKLGFDIWGEWVGAVPG